MLVVITRITRDGDKFTATLVTRPLKKWVIECKAADLRTFEAFRKICLFDHDVSIDHWSQFYYPRTVRPELWDRSIAKAMRTGGAGELPEEPEDSKCNPNMKIRITELGLESIKVEDENPSLRFYEATAIARQRIKLRRERQRGRARC